MPTEVKPGTIACIRLCSRDPADHRHDLMPVYGPMMRLQEKPFTAVIAGLCRFYGLAYCHVPDARRALVSPGWPDFEIWGLASEKALRKYVELKTYRGTVTAAQRRLGGRLLDWGEDFTVWRPLDLYNGTIEGTLAQMSGRPGV
jgi:hypothetical protein